MKKMADKYKMLLLPVIINTTLFFLLSILHFYWAVGGRFWYDDVLPTNSNGLNRMNPSTTASLIIAFGFLFFAFITIGNLGLFDKHIKRKYFHVGLLIITIIFFFRAIGDFKFFGFFKTISRTRFGLNDTQIFTPLCVFIALLSLLIFVFQRSIKYSIQSLTR